MQLVDSGNKLAWGAHFCACKELQPFYSSYVKICKLVLFQYFKISSLPERTFLMLLKSVWLLFSTYGNRLPFATWRTIQLHLFRADSMCCDGTFKFYLVLIDYRSLSGVFFEPGWRFLPQNFFAVRVKISQSYFILPHVESSQSFL